MTLRTVRRALVGLAAAALTTTALTATASAAPADAGPGHGGHTATQAAMEAQVEAGVPGLLGQARDGDGIWQGSAGVADLRTGRERLPQDRFRVGSITKAFVSTVLLQLEAEGRLGLDDTVEHHLPGLVRGNGNDGSRITLRQLLSHTSGVYNYTEDPDVHAQLSTGFPEHRYESRTPRQLVAVALKHRPDFRPGTRWHYSNTNYILAGMIVEKVTGHPYGHEIDRRILGPLGMRSTSLPGSSPLMPSPHGRAYSKLLSTDPQAPVQDVTELNPTWAWSAGEIISTTGDLNRFYRALLGGKLLPERQQKELTTTVSGGDELPGARYGLGVATVTLSCGVPVWFHGGGIHGSVSMASGTADGRHTAAFNLNGDWSGDPGALLEAEYCGTVASGSGTGEHTAVRKLAALN
ncbi:serine hydrolase domain-containing protein [Streptomyces sp. NPDC049577]|uniref:serine hydrolase domain-containing protein n=1 Tax=Streptomyces sp. NPDC049577 TaxID=3155153 RepID=UPI0034152BD3